MNIKKIALLTFLLLFNGFIYALSSNKDDYGLGFIGANVTWLIVTAVML